MGIQIKSSQNIDMFYLFELLQDFHMKSSVFAMIVNKSIHTLCSATLALHNVVHS